MTQFNTEKYKVAFESSTLKDKNNEPLKFYALKDITQYHLSRNVAANAQNIYSEAGLTKEMLKEICKNMTEAVNKNKLDEVSVWINNIKARMSYPVDEDSALRMAMIYHFIDGENPETCENHWTEEKLKKVKQDPEAYSFFLPIGLEFTPSYQQYLMEVSQSYLEQRRMTIRQLTPPPHQ
ncbi:hypothetical protein [Empedobacter sp.]|uniref:hypothetical protein n=1 Tax=Empedobacter sp. TaxID=1927715 RepID=UPI00289B0083|nr:hypothetical protein [Empedobacter sp.]